MEAGPITIKINSIRFVFALTKYQDDDVCTTARCELDSHADTCCGGPNFMRIDDGEHTLINVVGFNGAKSSNVPLCSAATLYTDPKTGFEYMLVFHQMLYFGNRLRASLLNPNQMRFGGAMVHDVPRQFDSASTHDIKVPIKGGPDLRIPLDMKGIISTFVTRKPTLEEYEDTTIPHLMVTLVISLCIGDLFKVESKWLLWCDFREC